MGMAWPGIGDCLPCRSNSHAESGSVTLSQGRNSISWFVLLRQCCVYNLSFSWLKPHTFWYRGEQF